jgi:hypothetical protein
VPLPPLKPRLAHYLDAPSRIEARRDASGALRCEGRIARAGVQAYRLADGSVKHWLRPEAEVFAPETMASFEAVPVTLEHPVEGEVTSSTFRALARGAVSSVRPSSDAGWVAASLLVQDAEAIQAIESGKVQLSCGYSAMRTDHVPPIPYSDATGDYMIDATISAIRGNHVALTDTARAGPGARLILDSEAVAVAVTDDATPVEAAQVLNEASTKYTVSLRFPSTAKDAAGSYRPDEVLGVFDDEASARAVCGPKKAQDSSASVVVDTLTADLAAQKTILDAALVERTELKALNEKLALEVMRLTDAASPTALDRLAIERAAVLAVAVRHGVVTDSVSTHEVRRAVVAKVTGLAPETLATFSDTQGAALFGALPALERAPAPELLTTVAAPHPSPVEVARAERAARLGY